MDVIGGLTAAKLAIDIAKDIKDIDRSVDEAAFKMKVAELTVALADTHMALADAKATIGELRNQIEELKEGQPCPKCLDGKMRLNETQPHVYGGLNIYGVEEWHYVCNVASCGFEQSMLKDPHGAIAKAAAKRA